MTVISETIPHFFNGVSQQAPTLRRTSQVEDQVNCYSSITEGIIPRPQLNHLAELSDTPLPAAEFHTINRSPVERFSVVISNGQILVYDLQGNPQTVTYPAGTGYLNTANPEEDFEVFTIKDFTFIVNTTRTTGTLDTPVVSALPGGLAQNTHYYVRVIDDVTVALYPTENDAVNDTNRVNITSEGSGVMSLINVQDEVLEPSGIVWNFSQDLAAIDIPGGFATGTAVKLTTTRADIPPQLNEDDTYFVRQVGTNTYRFYRTADDARNDTDHIALTAPSDQSGTASLNFEGDDNAVGSFVIESINTTNNTLNIPSHNYYTASGRFEFFLSDNLIRGTVQDFSDLGDIFEDEPAGTFYRVEGSPDLPGGTYYVQKTVRNPSTDNGDVYVEVANPEISLNSLDPQTMPHQLVRTGTNTFEFQQIEWSSRVAGDDDTNPFPSFVGSEINDLFLNMNRLGFLSGDNVIHSEASGENFFNFFRTTVSQLLDSDPIDVSVNDTQVTDLTYAVPFTDSLLLFSQQRQFELRSDGLLTPDTIEVNPTTAFFTSNKARPVLAGRNVYFPTERTNNTGIREYFVGNNDSGNDASDITKHVPRYIPLNVFKIVANTNDDSLVMLTRDEPNILYIYQWYWQGSASSLDKVQSAWHKWDVGEGVKVLNADIIDNLLYLIVEREGKVFLESLDLTPRRFEDGLDFQVRLDRRVVVQGVYDALEDTTRWTLPYGTDTELIVVRNGEFTENAGLQVLSTSKVAPNIIEAPGDQSEAECIIGINFTKTLELSPFYVRQQSSGGGSVARLGGKLLLKKLKIFCNDSAFFRVEVTPKARPTRTKEFTPVIGAEETVIGSSLTRDDTFPVVIMSSADTTKIKITSDSYLPFGIISAEWEGIFNSNAR